MKPDKSEQAFCSLLSRQAEELLFATATPTRLYLLLQYQGEWGNKALEESSLPEGVKERLKRFSKANPEVKVLLMRSGQEKIATERPERNSAPHGAQEEAGITFYAALVEETERRLYRFELGSYQELLGLELEGFLSGGEAYEEKRTDEQLALVCTNGRRDLCCARFGTPVYNYLKNEEQEFPGLWAWQSTHMGGHRFAANLLWLPDGVLYGRVDALGAAEILAAQRRGQVYLPNLRGRTAYPEAAQAADFYLHQRSSENALDAYQLREIEERGENRWRVGFFDTRSGAIQRVEVALEIGDQEVYESCTLDKATRIKYYRLIE